MRLCIPSRMGLTWQKVRLYSTTSIRSSTSGVERVKDESVSREAVLKHQNELFTQYKAKFMSDKVPRIKKIEVQYTGQSICDDATLLMNQMLSTPYHCAMHISKEVARDSVLAYVKKSDAAESEDGTIVEIKTDTSDGELGDCPSTEISTITEKSTWQPWDMNRPLEFDCELKLLHFSMNSSAVQEIKAVNRAYWDSCALVLGAVATEAFKEELDVQLVHLPQTSEKCGAFCYDVDLTASLLNDGGSSKWCADEAALINLTKLARNIISQNLNFERLEVRRDDAVELFKHNKHFLRRIEEGVFKTVKQSHVPLYRFGKHIDICDGPLVPSTSSIFHFVVTAVHQLKRRGEPHCLWRFQGLSLPRQLQVHHAVWAVLEHRARNLVKENLPFAIMDSTAHQVSKSFREYTSIENRTKKYNIATEQWLTNKWDSSYQSAFPRRPKSSDLT